MLWGTDGVLGEAGADHARLTGRARVPPARPNPVMPDLAGIDLALAALREYPAVRMLIISGFL